MARWDPDPKGRLERAALELFAEQGFSSTTVPQIAARAELTTRTFFRHFADKREVLFAGEEEQGALIARLVGAAPPELSAMAALRSALGAAAETAFEPHRESLRRWRAVVTGDDALRERGLRKQQVVVDAAARALEGRGVDAPTAEMAAGAAFVAFQSAVAEWFAAGDAPPPLTAYLDAAFDRMRAVVERG